MSQKIPSEKKIEFTRKKMSFVLICEQEMDFTENSVLLSLRQKGFFLPEQSMETKMVDVNQMVLEEVNQDNG
jgi:hypothetical protein